MSAIFSKKIGAKSFEDFVAEHIGQVENGRT